MGPLLLLLALVALLLVFAAGMVAQSRRGTRAERVAIYGIDEAVEYVWERLPSPMDATVAVSDVRRILEWEMLYLQQPSNREGPAVVGSTESAAYVQERAYEAGHPYEPDVIFAVIDLQAQYLVAIGAVGDVADAPE